MQKPCFPCGFNYLDDKTAKLPEKEEKMTTAACGIDCTVCRLHVSGLCSACGPGYSMAAREKLGAQMRLFNQGCPILVCAVERQIGHCLRDCNEFPCANFSSDPYPFSQSFLEMQKRRREKISEENAAAWPETTPEFWRKLTERSPDDVCICSGAEIDPDGGFKIVCLGETWRVDPERRSVIKEAGDFGGEWDRQMPFLILVYLALASEEPMKIEFIAPRDLIPGRDFFQGKYALETEDLKRVFGYDADGFLGACRRLNGAELDDADASVRFQIFPKFAVDYLLWIGDEEFDPNITILLNKSLANHYPPDASAVVINLLNRRLLLANKATK